MNKKFIAALLAIACYGIHANAQAIIVTKSNDNKIVLPANNVKDITTTTDNLAESLDYYTKDEANSQLRELRVKHDENEMRIYELMNYTNNLEQEIHSLKADMCNKDNQIEKLNDAMKNNVMQIEVLTKELQELKEHIAAIRAMVDMYHH